MLQPVPKTPAEYQAHLWAVARRDQAEANRLREVAATVVNTAHAARARALADSLTISAREYARQARAYAEDRRRGLADLVRVSDLVAEVAA